MTAVDREKTDRMPASGREGEPWLLGEARGVSRELIKVVAATLTAGFLIVLQARLLAHACHRLVFAGEESSPLAPVAGWLLLLAAARGGLAWYGERRGVAAAALVKAVVRRRLYRRLQLLVPTGVVADETASLVETVTTGVDGVEPYLARFLPQLVLAALLPPVVLGFVFPTEWRSGLVLLFSAPFIPLLMILIGRGSESLNRRQWRHLARLSGHLLDLVQGLPDLKIFGAAREEAAAVARVSADYRHATMAVLRIAFLSAFTLEFFATVGTAVVAVVIGFRLLGGGMMLHEGLFVLLLAPEFYFPLRALGLSYHARMQGVAAAERIAPLMSLPVPSAVHGNVLPPGEAPAIRLERVSFRYGGDRGGVSAIDLELPAGSLTVLTGESGAGKTTLMRLVAGLARPEQGRITVNGVDAALLDHERWRARIAWVSQRPFFFRGTIRDNLLLGQVAASADEIREALAAAAATFIHQLPRGLDTKLGDRGAGLSGGELRRLALARAYLRNASLLLLDEPTAGLDAENEALVGEALQRLAEGRTVLLISHREEIIGRAGRIVLLSGGKLEGVKCAAEPPLCDKGAS